jgi:hypothetical protein
VYLRFADNQARDAAMCNCFEKAGQDRVSESSCCTFRAERTKHETVRVPGALDICRVGSAHCASKSLTWQLSGLRGY